MNYQDSIKKAKGKMSLVVNYLTQWHLAPNPINYAVGYEYVSGNKHIITAIKQQLALTSHLDQFFCDNLYREVVLGQEKFRDEIITDLDQVIDDVQQHSNQTEQITSNFINSINDNLNGIESLDPHDSKLAALKIRKAALSYKSEQHILTKSLQHSKETTKKLQQELEEVRKELYLDPLTGLYNRKAMQKHFDEWLATDANRDITAISIHVNEIQKFSQQYGQLLSDVVLSKVASRINTYVSNSGIAVRNSGDQVLIFLPDINQITAGEIAEKIRQGINKLSFVRKKSGLTMPKVTLSLGISSFKPKNGLTSFLQQSKLLLSKAQTVGTTKILYSH